MRKFLRHKTSTEIKAQCKACGIQFDDRLYRQTGSDWIVVRSPGVEILYNVFTGVFFGTVPRPGRNRWGKTIQIDSSKTTHEKQPWFQELLAFFYVPEPTNAIASKPSERMHYGGRNGVAERRKVLIVPGDPPRELKPVESSHFRPGTGRRQMVSEIFSEPLSLK